MRWLVLRFVASAPIVAVILYWSGPVAAVERCAGVDLVQKARDEDAEAYRRIESAAASIPNAEGRLWRVSFPGKPASWLFGTLHVADDRLTPLKQPVLDAVATSTIVLVEPEEIADPERARAAQSEAGRRAVRPGGKALFRVPAEQRMKVINMLAARGLLEVNAQQLEPWFLAVIANTPPCALAQAETGVPNVDMAVVEAARSRGIEVAGLETVGEQVDALSSVGEELALRSLEDAAALQGAVGDFLETMISQYQASRTGLFIAAIRAGSGGQEMVTQLDYVEATLRGRNERMERRIAPHLDKGGAFVAVGALHLHGDDGLVARLRAAGASVEKVL